MSDLSYEQLEQDRNQLLDALVDRDATIGRLRDRADDLEMELREVKLRNLIDNIGDRLGITDTE